jgi:hypothetical protein
MNQLSAVNVRILSSLSVSMLKQTTRKPMTAAASLRRTDANLPSSQTGNTNLAQTQLRSEERKLTIPLGGRARA